MEAGVSKIYLYLFHNSSIIQTIKKKTTVILHETSLNQNTKWSRVCTEFPFRDVSEF